MASYPPPYPPPGYDPRAQRRFLRDQARMARDQARAQRQQIRFQQRAMRRTSVLGPILCIATGIIFLLIETGRLSHQAFWDWYGRRWPLLLVGAGILLLAEWAFDQHYQRDPAHPQYRRSIGGGVVTLILFLAAIGFVADQAHLHVNGDNWFYGWKFDPNNFDQFLGDKHESDQTLDLAFPASGSLNVDNPHGDVTISGASTDDKIHIAIHKQVYSRTDSDAESKAQQLTASTTTSGSALTLSMPTLEGTRADLVITVPAQASANITANHGDIHINSLNASVNVTANHGDIELISITGPATAHINNRSSSISARSLAQGLSIEGHGDDVTLSDIAGPVSISGDYFGTTHLERIASSVHFHTSRTDFQLARLDGQVEISPQSDLSADQALGPLVLTTSGRNITLDRISGDISVTNRNGSIDLTAAPQLTGPALGNINLQDRNGSIKAILPEHASYVFQADTTNGNIDSDLPLPPPPSDDTARTGGRDSHKILTGTLGSGGPLVHITTTNADISIHKGVVAPLPPVPPAPPRVTLTPPVAPKVTLIPPAAPKASKGRPAAPAVPTPPVEPQP